MCVIGKTVFPLTSLCFLRCLVHFLTGIVPAGDIFGELGATGWLHWNNEVQWAVLYAQNCMLLIFVWYIGMVPFIS